MVNMAVPLAPAWRRLLLLWVGGFALAEAALRRGGRAALSQAPGGSDADAGGAGTEPLSATQDGSWRSPNDGNQQLAGCACSNCMGMRYVNDLRGGDNEPRAAPGWQCIPNQGGNNLASCLQEGNPDGWVVQSVRTITYERFCTYTCKPNIPKQITPDVSCSMLSAMEIRLQAQSPSGNGQAFVFRANPMTDSPELIAPKAPGAGNAGGEPSELLREAFKLYGVVPQPPKKPKAKKCGCRCSAGTGPVPPTREQILSLYPTPMPPLPPPPLPPGPPPALLPPPLPPPGMPPQVPLPILPAFVLPIDIPTLAPPPIPTLQPTMPPSGLPNPYGVMGLSQLRSRPQAAWAPNAWPAAAWPAAQPQEYSGVSPFQQLAPPAAQWAPPAAQWGPPAASLLQADAQESLASSEDEEEEEACDCRSRCRREESLRRAEENALRMGPAAGADLGNDVLRDH